MVGGGGSKTSNPKTRKRLESEQDSPSSYSSTANALKRAKDGSAFAKCEECNKDVPVALISMHSCTLDTKIKMNLEAQIVEKPTEVKKKPAEKKKSKLTELKEKKEKKHKKEKKAKSPNAPKCPSTAFFLFMEEFRKSFKEANPDCKKVSMVAKEGGEKWKSMTDEERKPYVDKAAELKAEYEKALENHDDADNEDDEKGSSDKEVQEEVEKVSDDE